MSNDLVLRSKAHISELRTMERIEGDRNMPYKAKMHRVAAELLNEWCESHKDAGGVEYVTKDAHLPATKEKR